MLPAQAYWVEKLSRLHGVAVAITQDGSVIFVDTGFYGKYRVDPDGNVELIEE